MGPPATGMDEVTNVEGVQKDTARNFEKNDETSVAFGASNRRKIPGYKNMTTIGEENCNERIVSGKGVTSVMGNGETVVNQRSFGGKHSGR